MYVVLARCRCKSPHRRLTRWWGCGGGVWGVGEVHVSCRHLAVRAMEQDVSRGCKELTQPCLTRVCCAVDVLVPCCCCCCCVTLLSKLKCTLLRATLSRMQYGLAKTRLLDMACFPFLLLMSGCLAAAAAVVFLYLLPAGPGAPCCAQP
jgi:hypothetical protein